jgi:hypothetical protein
LDVGDVRLLDVGQPPAAVLGLVGRVGLGVEDPPRLGAALVGQEAHVEHLVEERQELAVEDPARHVREGHGLLQLVLAVDLQAGEDHVEVLQVPEALDHALHVEVVGLPEGEVVVGVPVLVVLVAPRGDLGQRVDEYPPELPPGLVPLEQPQAVVEVLERVDDHPADLAGHDHVPDGQEAGLGAEGAYRLVLREGPQEGGLAHPRGPVDEHLQVVVGLRRYVLQGHVRPPP